MADAASLIILGGTGPSGHYLLRHLALAGRQATLLSRKDFTAPEGYATVRLDLSDPGSWHAPEGATVISLLPLWILAGCLPCLARARAVIATGSTSVFSKSASANAYERDIAARLGEAETSFMQWAERHNIHWTLLRPTLIYDGKTDQNVARIARFIRRWHVLPLALPARGLRQPIHTDDVAKAVYLCLGNQAAANKSFNIAGGEILTYQEMVERIFAALGKKPRLLFLPVPVLRIVFSVALFLGLAKKSGFGTAIFQRMNEDLVFETEEGLRALGYAPRPFTPSF